MAKIKYKDSEGNIQTLKNVKINYAKPEEEWQLEPDWWNIDTILEEDTEEYEGKMIMLLSDNSNSLYFYLNQITNIAKIKMSDETEYNNPTFPFTHNWDISKDKDCSLGYKTRYVIFYFSNPSTTFTNTNANSWIKNFGVCCLGITFKNLNINFTNNGYNINGLINCEYVNFINCTITNLAFGRQNFKKIIFNENCINNNSKGQNNWFNNCNTLKKAPSKFMSINGISESMYRSFLNCYELKGCIEFVDTLKVTTMHQCFSWCYNIEEIKNLDTSSSTSCIAFLENCRKLTKLTNCNLNFEKCEGINLQAAFINCWNLPTLKVKNITNNITSLYNTFSECHKLSSIEFENCDFSNITNLQTTFFNCYLLKSINIDLQSSKVTNFYSTFYNCVSLKHIENIDFESATNISNVFIGCYSLQDIGISNIKISGLNFSDCISLSHESLINILNALYDYSGNENTYTITLGASNLAKLTEEELAIGTNKNWTIS